MANTTFIDGTTVVTADWCNDLNDAAYEAIGDGSQAPKTPAEVRTNLDVPKTDGTGATGTWSIDISGNAATATNAINATNASNATGPLANTTTPGIIELATNAEAQAGTSTSVVLTPSNLKAAQITLETAVTLTNQTFVDFTGIPSWVKRITIHLFGVSTNGTTGLGIQLGDSGGVETTGYTGVYSLVVNASATQVAATTSILGIAASNAANIYYGSLVVSKVTGNSWIAHGILGQSAANFTAQISGGKILSDVLDRIRVTTGNGIDQFDAGTLNITWE